MRDPDVLLRELVALASNVHPGPRGTYDLGKAGYEKLAALAREVTAETPAPKHEDHPLRGGCTVCVKRAKNRADAIASLQEDVKQHGISDRRFSYTVRRSDGQHVEVVFRAGKWLEV